MDLGLLVARLVLGALMAAHGAQKLFGWFGGYGLTGVGAWLESIGYKPGKVFALAAGSSEFAGGLLIAAGLLGPVGPALVIATMIVAAGSVHWPNVFAASNGIELPLVYGVGAAALALTGYGAYSIDRAFDLAGFWSPAIVWSVLTIGIVGGIVTLSYRHPGQKATA
jgi:putative oxidoreductase